MGAPYIYDISRLRVKDLHSATYIYVVRRLRVNNVAGRQWRNSKQCSVKVYRKVGQSEVRGQVLRISLKILGCITAEKFLTCCLITSTNF